MDPDQTAPEEQSDLGPHCLSFCQQYFDSWPDRKMGLCTFYDKNLELQIREGIEDNSEIIFHISEQKHMLNRLEGWVLMIGHKIFFMEKYC